MDSFHVFHSRISQKGFFLPPSSTFTVTFPYLSSRNEATKKYDCVYVRWLIIEIILGKQFILFLFITHQFQYVNKYYEFYSLEMKS